MQAAKRLFLILGITYNVLFNCIDNTKVPQEG